MIFATVGTQLPFARLIDALDALAPNLQEPIVAQVGASQGQWPHLEVHRDLPPAQFGDLFAKARIVVAHAGIGTILSAKKAGKPLVLLPRRYALGEHRNDHQMATAKQVADLPGMHIAWDIDDLADLLQSQDLTAATQTRSPSHAALIAHINAFIET